MIIDVVDLNLKTLQFNKRYDMSRYNRGNQIYNRGDVQVEKVETDGENNYEIKATVEGNYDNYTTKLSISGNLIKESSCTCEDYNKGNLCKHIIATSMEVIEPHYARTPEGRRKLQKKEEEEQKRRLEEIRKRHEYENKYHSVINTIEKYKRNLKEESRTNNLDLVQLYEQTAEIKNKKIGNLATSVKLEYAIEIENKETLKVTFKIGQTRMYILNNITTLYNAYKNETEIYYGKQLRFIPKRENFTEESKNIFDFIIKYAEMIEYNNKYNRYGIDNSLNKAIYLTGEKINEFFEMNKNKNIMVNEYSSGMSEYKITEEKLDIKCILDKEIVKISSYDYWYGSWYMNNQEEKESEEYVFKLNIEDYAVLISNNKIYIFYKNKIYTLDKEKNLLNIFEIFNREDKILIPEDRLDEFKQFVLPNVKNIETKNLPEEIVKEGIIVNKLASKILLDTDDKGNILLELKFCYMDYEFNILESGYKTYVKEHKIVRDIPSETEVLKRLFIDGFEFFTGRKEFIMKDDDNIYEFLKNKIEGYMKDFEVLATDRFKNKQIKQPKISNIGIRIDNGLLELDISKINIDINEIKDILKDYNIKKKYHKLKNGDILDLTNSEDLNLLDEMSSTLDIDYNKVTKGIINLPVNRSFYLEKLMENNKEISVSKNDKFNELIDNAENSANSVDIEIDKTFEKNLREYQKVGYRWLKTLDRYKFGGILADDMGLRKNTSNYSSTKIRTKIQK